MQLMELENINRLKYKQQNTHTHIHVYQQGTNERTFKSDGMAGC